MSLLDVTDTAPLRRMSVARGTLTGVPAGAKADLGLAEAAAVQAVKATDRFVPTQHAVQPTHVQVDIDQDGEAVSVTVTVQAFARRELDTAALTGVAAALLTLRDQLGAARLDLHLVQNVA